MPEVTDHQGNASHSLKEAPLTPVRAATLNVTENTGVCEGVGKGTPAPALLVGDVPTVEDGVEGPQKTTNRIPM